MASIAINQFYIPEIKIVPDSDYPDELMCLVARAMDARVLSCRRVTKLTGRSIRQAYRVELSDGRLIKVRHLWNMKQAAEIEKHLRFLNGRHVPKVLSRISNVLMLEWIDGEILDKPIEDYTIYKRCGRLLAWIQSQPVETKPGEARKKLANLAPRIRSDVDTLREWELLTPAEAARLTDKLRRYVPDSDELCLIHGDFCGENLAIRAHFKASISEERIQHQVKCARNNLAECGRVSQLPQQAGVVIHALRKDEDIYSIDNEAMTIGFPDADLARAFMRWNLSGRAQTAFLTGYSELRSLDSFYSNERFWKLVSLIRSIRYRYKCQGAEYQETLMHLKQLISESC